MASRPGDSSHDGRPGAPSPMRIFFLLFLVSGFCGLVYEVVWLRLAMAQFGVTSQMVAIVLSVFMCGLALGSWGAGRLAARGQGRPAALIRLYGLAELLIGLSGPLVPRLLPLGRVLLTGAGPHASWGSASYHLISGLWVCIVLLPFCTAMGATFPIAMGALRDLAEAATHSFSHLYTANVLGAAMGTLLSAFVLIELLGFRGTLLCAAALNLLLALSAFVLAARARPGAERSGAIPTERRSRSDPAVLAALFTTGFTSMAMEVVWVREFTPYTGNMVYGFAAILAIYLAATFLGSRAYRRRASSGRPLALVGPRTWATLALFGLAPLVAADPRLHLPFGNLQVAGHLAFGLAPFCALLGFVTPYLVDLMSGGEPRAAGTAYAVNVVGCILGPLAAGFVLLPLVGERGALSALALPLLLIALAAPGARPDTASRLRAVGVGAVLVALVALATRTFEESMPGAVIRRDSTATVSTYGQALKKRLLVNGIGMTRLTAITKVMAHLPLAEHQGAPRKALVVCLGMGTSFRSAMSWGIETTAVELVPSVAAAFGFFHPDAPALLRSPSARLVIDDGRRFLERSSTTYDVILIDPPPPNEAAGSSLLYSREFYQAVRARLAPGGILQQWVAGGDPKIAGSFVRTARDAFPYARGFVSVEGWGLHVLGSERPIPDLTAAQLAARLPAAAARDLVEWGPERTPEAQFDLILRHEVTLDALIASMPGAQLLEDDRPFNEYFLLGRQLAALRSGR